ncbi:MULTISPECIES: copper resistance system multicopper oxidase [Sphingomonadaceae]|uniref:Copper-resistance protein CopA n=1 Tax=Novosphingobium pentaromativorans US6-1 TaxID=1088721 RepID=G6EJM8_9SPHN|nr:MULTISPECIES: copper resistance system multicopper oxidase [Sphingomonadaceae]AIT82348.1 copper-binding protein [Novosphingobium pentaromativorans US6-1]EHJ58497.1 Copper-resistance protein CopA [Novosphingobium pentaromativorans US6-1]KKC27540.1 copper-binding protein [Sphingomonas sp. SRS2]ODU35484.1 MAG: copper-binding protein [Sphingopyxis sp. SCN 67-31]
MTQSYLDRRAVLRGATLMGSGVALAGWLPAWAQPVSAGIAPDMPVLSGEEIAIRIAHQPVTIDGRTSHGIAMNGTIPAPLIRLREGQNVRIAVTNALDEDSSVHWHGLILPAEMDGVPGISFPGIRPNETFVYEFPIVQSGTYWYHSHSGLQEQLGHYGPIIIDPAGEDPVRSDREHVIVLSDYSATHPHVIFRKLKQQGGYFNRRRQTLAGLLAGRDQTLRERLRWGAMRMDPTDVADVTGAAYTYLVNGHGPADNWTGLFRPGERVRLRVINAAAMTIFNFRIPGLKLTIVQADGQNVRPVAANELQITVAETYDVIVEPVEDRPYTIVAEASDRSGMGCATLAPRAGMSAQIPLPRERPILTMTDMGMSAMDHGALNDDSRAGDGGHAGHGAAVSATATPQGSHAMRDFSNVPNVARTPAVQSIAPMPIDRTGEPGIGLDDVGHDVLTYRHLMALDRNPDVRAPSRSLQIHLTGNMERYMWAFDGVTFNALTAPIPFRQDERVRITLINDTMMAHPIHLHGHFFELVTGHGSYAPRKHTVNVLPGGSVTLDVTTDALGDWAFHCHLLYHMHAGMMHVVAVRAKGTG